MNDRASWLADLTEGQPVQIVTKVGSYPARVGEIREEDIPLKVDGLADGMMWVWRSCGTRPDWECYIAPTDAPSDYPSPLTRTDWSAA